jgi:glycosyltransferase involved in cell wall biosynthesis
VTVAKPKVDTRTTVSTWVDLLEKPKTESCRNSFNSLTEKDKPLVSVVIVHYNRHKLLQQTIESLEAQTYKNFEVIIVDDGSTDPASIQYLDELSWTWWQERGWKVIRESNRYLGASRNTGAKSAIGKYILFIDDDDYSKPHQIETLLKVAMNTNAEVVTAGHDVFNGLWRPTTGLSNSRYIPIGPDSVTGMLENVFGDSAMLVRREFFVDVGGFTEDYGVGFEDYEFLAKTVLEGHHLEAVPESLHWYRRHSNTMSSGTNLKTNQLRMMRPYLDSEEKFSLQHKALLEHTKRMFFEKHGITFEQDPFFTRRSTNVTSTTTTAAPTITNLPNSELCGNYLDQSGASSTRYNSLQVFLEDRETW